MVKTRASGIGKENIRLTKEAIAIFGKKTLIHRVPSNTYDEFGAITAISNTDTTFTGDLQFGLDLDQRLIEMGYVETGDAVLYIAPDALSTIPKPQDIILDGNSRWEIVSKIESPEIGGDVTHLSYRCVRLIEESDN